MDVDEQITYWWHHHYHITSGSVYMIDKMTAIRLQDAADKPGELMDQCLTIICVSWIGRADGWVCWYKLQQHRKTLIVPQGLRVSTVTRITRAPISHTRSHTLTLRRLKFTPTWAFYFCNEPMCPLFTVSEAEQHLTPILDLALRDSGSR